MCENLNPTSGKPLGCIDIGFKYDTTCEKLISSCTNNPDTSST